jgi:hypothetical protein
MAAAAVAANFSLVEEMMSSEDASNATADRVEAAAWVMAVKFAVEGVGQLMVGFVGLIGMYCSVLYCTEMGLKMLDNSRSLNI